MTWNDLTVGQYQQLYKVLKQTDKTNLDVLTEVISICEGYPIDEIDSWEFKKLMDKEKEYLFLEKLDFDKTAKKYINTNGKRYKFVHKITEIPAARYIESKHFLKGDFIDDIHYLMASCVKPMRKTWRGWVEDKYDAKLHSEYAADMQKAKFVEVHNCVVFFYLLFVELIKGLGDYLTKEVTKTMTADKAAEVQIALQKITDGFTALNK
jgi:hypothetical protein